MPSLPPGAVGATSKTLSMYYSEDGRRHVIRGAMGNLTIRGSAGQRAVAEWSFTGRLDTPTDVALPTYSQPTALPIRVAAAALTIASFAPKVADFSIEAWDRVLAVNLRGAFLISKFAIPHILERGGGAILGVGSVAGACVRKSMTDVLMVRDATGPTGAAPFKTIVAAVDFSPTSLRAVRRAAAFAAKDGAELHLLHVFQSPWRQLHPRATTPAPPGLEQHREGLERRLTEFCRPALEPSAIPAGAVRSVVYDGAGHRSGIVEYAGRVRADLIVLGTRGRTNLRDLLLGGTAEKAIEESRCSILVVKPEGFEHPLAAEPQPRPVQMRTLS